MAIVKLAEIAKDPNLNLSANHWISIKNKDKAKKKKNYFCKSNKNK